MKTIGTRMERVKTDGIPDVVRPAMKPYDMNTELAFMERCGQKACSHDFVIDKANRAVFTELIRWANADPAFGGSLVKGIYLCGSTGTGKTWAMRAFAAYCSAREFRWKSKGRADWLLWVRRSAINICLDYGRGGWPEYTEATTLLVDDLGAEPTDSNYMGNRLEVMKSLIVERADRGGLLTSFTSNIPMAKLAEKYDERIASRIQQICNCLVMRGKDRRLTDNIK